MKRLDKKATQVFDMLIQRMNGKQHLKIENESFMPLTIEKIGESIRTPYGIGDLYSLCHYYVQNGDLMQDPEMCFIVVDNRNGDVHVPELLVILPYMFQQANIGLYGESMIMEGDRLTRFNRKLQAEHTGFANQWLRNIQSQGYLKTDQS